MANNFTISELKGKKYVKPIEDGILIPVSVMEGDKYVSGAIETTDMPEFISRKLANVFAAKSNEVSTSTIHPGNGITVTAHADGGVVITNSMTHNLYKVVSELPTSGQDDSVIYIVASTDTADNNVYSEYAWVKGTWEQLGTHKPDVDLSDYAKTAEVNTAISTFETTKLNTAVTSLEGKINSVKGTSESNAANIRTNTSDITTLKTKVSNLETASATHASATELSSVKAAQEKDAQDIVKLNTKIGKHAVAASEGVEAVEGSGILKEIDDLEAAYKAADSAMQSTINAHTTTLSTLATKTSLQDVKTIVDGHTTELSSINTTLGTKADSSTVTNLDTKTTTALSNKADKTSLDNYVLTTTLTAHETEAAEKYALKTALTPLMTTAAADAKFITPAGVDTKIADLDLKTKFDSKASATDVTALTGRVTTLEGKSHLSTTDVNGLIDTKIASKADKTYVDNEISSTVSTINTTLSTDYLSKTGAASLYATQVTVTDITKNGGTIDTKVNAAKDDLQGKLNAANSRITTLETKVASLEAKMAAFVERFGFDYANNNWTKSFLQID